MKAYQRVYTKLEGITKATVSLRAKGVSNDELAIVDGRLAQVVRTKGDVVTLQVFSGTEGIPTNAEVAFLGAPPTLKVSDQLIAIAPNLAEAYFNAGTSYVNLALKLNERKDKKQIRQLYQKARPYMEQYRKLMPKEKEKWGPALYRIYLNLNMGKQFDEIDQLLKN